MKRNGHNTTLVKNNSIDMLCLPVMETEVVFYSVSKIQFVAPSIIKPQLILRIGYYLHATSIKLS